MGVLESEFFANFLEESKNRMLREKREPRVRVKPLFTDPDYQALTNVWDIRYSPVLDVKESRTVVQDLLSIKEQRLQIFAEFLDRHNVHISFEDDDFTELDEFLAKNMDFNERFGLDYWMMSDYWMSIMIDLSLYLGDSYSKRYPMFRLHYDTRKSSLAYRGLGLGEFILENGRKYSVDIIADIISMYDGLIKHKDYMPRAFPLSRYIKSYDGSIQYTLGRQHQ